MLRYRTFRNTDPPAVAAIWRSRAGQPGLLQPISVDLLEQFVFGKLYFDYHGMILAFDDQKPVGMAHAAFGPNERHSGISTKTGVIPLVLVRPEYEHSEVAAELLTRCEAYLADRGAEAAHGGALFPLAPFYWGLYGGVEPPGVLDRDTMTLELYRQRGYREIEQTLILRQDLAAFQSSLGRQEFQFRRRLLVQVIVDPPTPDFWEASTMGDLSLTRFELVPRGGGAPLAHVIVRQIEWSDGFVPCPAAGLIDLAVDHTYRRQGLATFLLKECFRSLAPQGVRCVEVQVRHGRESVIALYRKLGFAEVGRGIVFRKELRRPAT